MLRSPLLHFLLIGALLYVAQSVGSRPASTPVVEISRAEIEAQVAAYARQMGRVPGEAEARAIERQVIDNALWLEQAYALGLHEIDSVVRQRLLQNMRFLEGMDAAPADPPDDGAPAAADADEEEALLERAIELGMDRSDTVVQRRLVDRVQAIVRAGVRARALPEDVLRAHYESTRERWREPSLLDLSHVYLSRDARGEATRADAEALLARLSPAAGEAMEVEAAIALGDPFLAGHRLRGATPNRLVARLGPAFAEGVEDAPEGRWFGPVASAFGEHLVWVHERVPSRIPPLEEVADRVREDWIEEESRAALRAFVDQRRAEVEIRIVEDAASDAPTQG